MGVGAVDVEHATTPTVTTTTTASSGLIHISPTPSQALPSVRPLNARRPRQVPVVLCRMLTGNRRRTRGTGGNQKRRGVSSRFVPTRIDAPRVELESRPEVGTIAIVVLGASICLVILRAMRADELGCDASSRPAPRTAGTHGTAQRSCRCHEHCNQYGRHYESQSIR